MIEREINKEIAETRSRLNMCQEADSFGYLLGKQYGLEVALEIVKRRFMDKDYERWIESCEKNAEAESWIDKPKDEDEEVYACCCGVGCEYCLSVSR